MSGGSGAVGSSATESPLGQLPTIVPSYDPCALASRATCTVDGVSVASKSVKVQSWGLRGRDPHASLGTDLASAASEEQVQSWYSQGLPVRASGQQTANADLTVAGFKFRLEKMLVRDGRHPVRSHLPKFSSTPTNEVCICALEAVESLYRDNGWVGVGTQSSLGYRVDH